MAVQMEQATDESDVLRITEIPLIIASKTGIYPSISALHLRPMPNSLPNTHSRTPWRLPILRHQEAPGASDPVHSP